jgi:hypothetical protein
MGVSTDFRVNRKYNKKNLWLEVFFCAVSALPRSSIQGALGTVPQQENYFDVETQNVFAEMAAFTIALMAPFGASVLEYFAPKVQFISFILSAFLSLCDLLFASGTASR